MILKSLLENIRSNKTTYNYSVSSVEGMEGIFFGIDKKDHPCLFINSNSIQSMPSIRTSHILVEFFRKYKLIIDDAEREGVYHSIQCLSNDQSDIQTFVAVLDSILLENEGKISVEKLNSIFHSLVNLFTIRSEGNINSIQKGLWVELFFMQQNEGFKYWAPTWHSEPYRIFDFSSGNKRTEIKSTTKQDRIHEFNHNQLVTMTDDEIVIVSFLLQEDDSGTSLRELIKSAKDELRGTSDYIKLERAIRNARMDCLETDGPRYNSEYASSNAAWFKSENAPRFPIIEPVGVSGTHYRSDLTTAERMNREEISKWIENWKMEA